jgi:hypothetical protein
MNKIREIVIACMGFIGFIFVLGLTCLAWSGIIQIIYPKIEEWILKPLWHFFKYVCSRNPHEWFVYFFPNAEMF